MKYRCRDCGYEHKEAAQLSAKCEKCGSFRIVPLTDSSRWLGIAPPNSASAKGRVLREKWDRKYQAVVMLVVAGLIYGAWYFDHACEETGSNGCPRLGRMLLGFARVVAMFSK